jgi:hypothetical protein
VNAPALGRIVEGGGHRLFTVRELSNGLFLYQRRHESNWGRQSPGWTIHTTRDLDNSLGYGRTLREAVALAKTIRA